MCVIGNGRMFVIGNGQKCFVYSKTRLLTQHTLQKNERNRRVTPPSVYSIAHNVHARVPCNTKYDSCSIQ